MRCPACGATNPDTAAWCGQCYRRFDAGADTGDDAGAQAPSADGSSTTGDAPPPPAAATPAAPAQGFRREGDELQWECPECAQFNGMEVTTCLVCGTSFLERFRSQEPEPVRNWATALLLSAVAPGAGHVSVGRYGTGLARLVLFCAWVLGAVLLSTSAGSGALIAATPLLLGAAVLWALTLVDLYRLQQGESEILAGRTFLWLVVVVLLLMGVALVASVATSAAPGG